MKIYTTYNSIFNKKSDIPDITKLISFSLIYQDYVSSMIDSQKDPADEANFVDFCNRKKAQGYGNYISEAKLIFTDKARKYSIDMFTIDNSLKDFVKETNARFDKVDNNTRRRPYSNFGWNIVSSMLGSAGLFCLLAGLSFLFLSLVKEDDMKPFQYIGKAMDNILWKKESTKR